MGQTRKADSNQIGKFRQLARELECDDDEEAFKAKVEKVLRAPKGATKAANDAVGKSRP